MPSIAVRIFLEDREVGTLEWDRVSGMVTGYMAGEIARYGASPWYFSPLSFGDSSTPALRSNDGFIALLCSLGFSTPDLTVENPAVDNNFPGVIN